MKNHTKVYFTALGYDITDFVPSEISGAKAIDVCHIIGRGRGGKDHIENLMALTREEHDFHGENNSTMVYQFETHRQFLIDNGVKFKNSRFEEKIKIYS